MTTDEYNKLSIQKHKESKWKISINSKVSLDTKEDLSIYYTPWVAEPCREIASNPEKAYDYTWKWNSVAVVSDWSAVLWLWNIWWLAWLPVMEWKAVLFKWFWGIDAVPIVLKTQDPDEIINIVENISPTFGWINLEDIKAPNCFYIEEELKKRLNIPVFHDDQHWTAIVVLAGLINAIKLAGKSFDTIKVVISWAWSAGIAIANLLDNYWTKNIIVLDSQWAISSKREGLNKYKEQVSKYNLNDESWNLYDVIRNADVFVWVSQPNLLKADWIKTMANNPIIFAMANPSPEVTPKEAEKWWVFIYATGRSDYPNQINNLLVFPWIFKWALKYKKTKITTEHKLIVAEVLAKSVINPSVINIIPSPLEKWIADKIAESMKNI